MKNKKNNIQKISLTAMFIAMAFVLPFVTMQIESIGDMLCPMHIPVIICGFVCGGPWGFVAGIVAPLLRSLILWRPVLYPTGIAMMFELGTYGFLSGFLYKKLPSKKPYIYVSLVTSMIVGRIVWGVARLALFSFDVTRFGFEAFWAGAVLNAIPGIIVQIVLIPPIIIAIEKIFKVKK